MITCRNCKTVNPPDQQRCVKCGRNLLPGRGASVRLGVLIVSFAVGAFGVFILTKMAQGADLPDLGCAFTSPVYWIILTIGAPIMGLGYALQRTPLYEKYVDRAKRHLSVDPDQAVADFTQALNLAPEKQKGAILKERSKLLATLGRDMDAARDKIAAMDSEDAFAGTAGLATMIGADKDIMVSDAKSREQQEMVKSHVAVGLGWCKKCKAVVELDDAMRCKIHPTAKISDVHVAVPEDVPAELARRQAEITSRNKSLRLKRIILLITIVLVIAALCYLTNQ